MIHWMCSSCGYVFEAESPVDVCPSCHTRCTFSDISCCTPDCGGPGNIDYRLLAVKLLNKVKEAE